MPDPDTLPADVPDSVAPASADDAPFALISDPATNIHETTLAILTEQLEGEDHLGELLDALQAATDAIADFAGVSCQFPRVIARSHDIQRDVLAFWSASADLLQAAMKAIDAFLTKKKEFLKAGASIVDDVNNQTIAREECEREVAETVCGIIRRTLDTFPDIELREKFERLIEIIPEEWLILQPETIDPIELVLHKLA